ncbi:MAG: hypothetical protein J6Q79_06260 [Clostridia bacterium]|nr:hypothetical protein [Clostridia bacterium]
MNLIKTIKCLCCLVSCSKYLYYIKKALCVVTIVVFVLAFFCNMDKCRDMVSKFREM